MWSLDEKKKSQCSEKETKNKREVQSNAWLKLSNQKILHLINVISCVKRPKTQGIFVSEEWKFIPLSNHDLLHLPNVWSCIKRCGLTNTYFSKRKLNRVIASKNEKSRLSILCLFSTSFEIHVFKSQACHFELSDSLSFLDTIMCMQINFSWLFIAFEYIWLSLIALK